MKLLNIRKKNFFPLVDVWTVKTPYVLFLLRDNENRGITLKGDTIRYENINL